MHFAAFCYVGESVQQPRKYYVNNVIGTLNLLNAMQDAGVNRLVFSSSCSSYGMPQETPMTETHPQHPINPYGKTKHMVENMLQDYGVAYGLQSISLRYFNAAGCDPEGELGERHNPETHLIPLALQEALRERKGGNTGESKLCVFGDNFATPDGTCVRDYIHVQDLCVAHLAAMERLLSGKTTGAEAYNLGNGKGHSVKEVIEACRRVTGQQIHYQIVAPRAGDPSYLIGSSEQARLVLGWQPQIPDLEEIIRTAWSFMNLAKPRLPSSK
jgi:UDP-glucose-4-epimerase GalE